MAKDKTNLASRSVTALIGAKTITSSVFYRHGVVTVLELNFSDTTTNYIKFSSNGGLEVGGTSEVGTGTSVVI